MHKLDRLQSAPPQCLAEWARRLQAEGAESQEWWEVFGREGRECKRELRVALLRVHGRADITYDLDENATMFGVRCAYCEQEIATGGHIEHFRRKNPQKGCPELTFEWSNLFFSCDSKDHCGMYKDRPTAEPYNADDLVKPDNDDPDKFFYFHSTGEVLVRTDKKLTAEDQRRAEETIRVFHLNFSVLRGIRRNKLKKYREKFLPEIESWEEELRHEYIREELERTQWEPYATVIRHFLQR